MSGVTGVDVEHTKALEAAATPGPWVARPSPMGAMLPDEVFASGESFGRNVPAECHQREDAEFIAHARTAVPALVAAVERVQAQVDKALEILEEYDISEEEDFHQCAPEDRWRLYRDLTAALKPEALETKP
ncbi:hypothetical protein [Rhodococcus sp. NPDC055024]